MNVKPIALSLKVSKGLRTEGVLQQVADAATDQLRAYLGASLSTHSEDLQLIIDLCRALERCHSDTKFDKKACACMVLRALFPAKVATDEPSLVKLCDQIDVLHSYGLFERKSVLYRISKAVFSSEKKK